MPKNITFAELFESSFDAIIIIDENGTKEERYLFRRTFIFGFIFEF